jgi:hypothetical protein
MVATHTCRQVHISIASLSEHNQHQSINHGCNTHLSAGIHRMLPTAARVLSIHNNPIGVSYWRFLLNLQDKMGHGISTFSCGKCRVVVLTNCIEIPAGPSPTTQLPRNLASAALSQNPKRSSIVYLKLDKPGIISTLGLLK